MSAMQNGICWGNISRIEGLVERIHYEFGAPMMVIAAGGLTPLFAGGTKTVEHADSYLRLSGIAEFWGRSRRVS